MSLIPPQFKLAFIFAKMARDHGPKLLHSNNPDLLTKDLGDAMRRQKAVLSDPGKGAIMTAYDVLPLILEVKILSLAVASKLEIDTKGKPMINVLEEIVAKSEARNDGKFAAGIKETLGWTRALFADPDIQDVLAMPMTEIESPDLTLRGVGKFFTSLAGRSQDELVRVQEFLKHAKDVQEPPVAPVAPTPAPAAEQDKKPAKPRKPRTPKSPAA
ncbi:MAG TPA: hypothetical protein VEF76_01295 [Patescibacteria group bacterium]|nr:hypothetical protein [Patescibacteria group bacterium]